MTRTITIDGLTKKTARSTRYVLVEIAAACDAQHYANSPELDRPALPRRINIRKGSNSIETLRREDQRLTNKEGGCARYLYDLVEGWTWP